MGSREEIIVALWPDASPSAGRSAFHMNARQLRKALHSEALPEQSGRYRLHPDMRCWHDAAEFERLCREACGRQDETELATLARCAVALYRGRFLADLPAEWAQPQRDYLDALYMAVAIRLGRACLTQACYGEATHLAQTALAMDPYLAPAQELLMLSHTAAGQVAAALHHYRRWAQRLARDLDEDPPPELAALNRHILRSASPPASFATLAPELPLLVAAG
jgi:DNA-binding SARP family transcriptional activator